MTQTRHSWDTNPAPLTDEPETAVTIDGFDAFFPPPMTNGQRVEREIVETLKHEIAQAGISLDAADIKPGKLHERVGSALELLTHYRWEAGHYKALYMKRIEHYGGETK
jgi:hypothetical protein